MSLTGMPFLALVFLLTVAGFVLLVARWSSLSGAGAGRVAGRVALLLAVNFLVLLTAASALNAKYLFFASWTDLRGALTGTVTKTSLDKGTVAEASRRRAPGVAAVAVAHPPPLPRGRVSSTGVATFQVRGRASGIVGTVVVQLPSGYFDPANASRTYPVLEAISGYPGSPYQWTSVMHLGSAIASQVALGHMRPTLIVQPQSWIPPGVDTECVDGRPGYPQVEKWLTVDVPNWVAHTFRVASTRSSWATIGLSAGGWCAAMATILHPAQYGAAVVMGGYFRPELSPFYEPYPPGSPLAARYDLVAVARRAPPPVAVWLETSHLDAVSYRSSTAFVRAARPPLAIHAVVLQNAGHRIPVWEALLPESLQWLGSALPGFR